MIKVTFKDPQKIFDYYSLEYVECLFWLGWKTYDHITKLVLYSECGKHVQTVNKSNIKSIEHVKPTDL